MTQDELDALRLRTSGHLRSDRNLHHFDPETYCCEHCGMWLWDVQNGDGSPFLYLGARQGRRIHGCTALPVPAQAPERDAASLPRASEP